MVKNRQPWKCQTWFCFCKLKELLQMSEMGNYKGFEPLINGRKEAHSYTKSIAAAAAFSESFSNIWAWNVLTKRSTETERSCWWKKNNSAPQLRTFHWGRYQDSEYCWDVQELWPEFFKHSKQSATVKWVRLWGVLWLIPSAFIWEPENGAPANPSLHTRDASNILTILG